MSNSEGPVLLSGAKTVAVAGTAEAMVGASQRVKSVVIIAKSGNTNQVYVGGSDVDSATNGGLAAGESITVEAVAWLDLADIYLDVAVNGEGVDFYSVKAWSPMCSVPTVESSIRWNSFTRMPMIGRPRGRPIPWSARCAALSLTWAFASGGLSRCKLWSSESA